MKTRKDWKKIALEVGQLAKPHHYCAKKLMLAQQPKVFFACESSYNQSRHGYLLSRRKIIELFTWSQAYCQQWRPGEEVCIPPRPSWDSRKFRFWPFLDISGARIIRYQLKCHNWSWIIILDTCWGVQAALKGFSQRRQASPDLKRETDLTWKVGLIPTWEGWVVQGEEGGCAVLGPSQL